MPTQRRSRYKRASKQHLKPLRLSDKDRAIFNLFGPSEPGRFNYLTADLIALAADRPVGRVKHRLRQLWDFQYLNRYHEPYEQIGGSSKIVYLLDKNGAEALKDYLTTETEDRLQQGELSPKEAEKRFQYIKKMRPMKHFDPNGYHQHMSHIIATNRMRVITMAAYQHHFNVALPYQYPDGYLTIKFQHPDPKIKTRLTINPDFFYGGQPSPEARISNFALEVQMPSRKAKESSSQQLKNLRRKYEAYYYFLKYRIYQNPGIRQEYPDVVNWPDFRILTLTDTSDREHDNLIALAQKIDDRRLGMRNFWFAPRRVLDDKITILKEHRAKSGKVAKERIITKESLRHFFDPIWRTARKGDTELHSILETRQPSKDTLF